MADDRPLLSEPERVAELERRLLDLETTTAARAGMRPTGDVELAFRSTPKTGTLFMQGQTLNRADYPALWQWAQDHGAVVAGGYGAGNGSTTFTLPDMREHALVAAGGAYALGAKFGVDAVTLTTAQMPEHTHTGSAANAGTHTHSSDFAGSHGGHVTSQVGRTTGGDFAAHPSTSSGGSHNHDINGNGDHSHSISLNNTGGGGSHENRQRSIAINLAVWT